MADAADSKSAVRKGVWVRLPPRAPSSPRTLGCLPVSKSPAEVVKDAVTLQPCLSTDLVFVISFLVFFFGVAIVSIIVG
jgi:hypothetical protein